MSAEIINLNQKRQEHWMQTLDDARKIGAVAIFGCLDEQDAKILEFKRENMNE